jgi:hypothetical protein
LFFIDPFADWRADALGLAPAYALSGDTAKSKTAYQDFFTIWKNADPDIPIMALKLGRSKAAV